jgi:hypothetical protein
LDHCVFSLHLSKATFKSQTETETEESSQIPESIQEGQHFFVGKVGRMPTPEKAFRPASRNFDPDSNVTEEIDLQSTKRYSPKTSTDEGRIISTKPVRKNAFFSIRDNFDSDSNIMEESNVQSAKPHSLNTSTKAGRMISIKPVPKNASFAIRDNLDPDSNLTEESDSHL